ncbi:hypothetical protein [Stenotrophomonas rhizophila]|uniref:hypothetical protein n=1 Tax=Stenotrophomonas rhizophila TaxID=216778 RepID=UPI0011C450A5|nr:hypothetical protein [Stenotrophomonas rhizophila]
MSGKPTNDRKAAAIEVITRAAEAGDPFDPKDPDRKMEPDLRSLPSIRSIQDAANELGEPDPTTGIQQGKNGDYDITKDSARETGKACREILARHESKNINRNIGSALAGMSQTPKSSPKRKMFVTNLPGISD